MFILCVNALLLLFIALRMTYFGEFVCSVPEADEVNEFQSRNQVKRF